MPASHAPGMSPAVQAEHRLRRARCLYDAQAVQQALDVQAERIAARLGGKDPLLLGIMTGGMWPLVEISRRLAFPHQVDYLHASRYLGETKGGDVQWRVSPRLPLAGRHVLVIDDILDEGHTLQAVLEVCRNAGARSVLSAVLVLKRHARRVPGVAADFHALEIDDLYVFGCGMDVGEYWRGLPAIFALADGDA